MHRTTVITEQYILVRKYLDETYKEEKQHYIQQQHYYINSRKQEICFGLES